MEDFFFMGAVWPTELPRGCFFFFPNKDRLPRDSPLASEMAAVEAAALAATLIAATLSSSVLFFLIWEAECVDGVDDTVLDFGGGLLFSMGDRSAVGEVAFVGVTDVDAVSGRENEFDLEIRCIALSFLLCIWGLVKAEFVGEKASPKNSLTLDPIRCVSTDDDVIFVVATEELSPNRSLLDCGNLLLEKEPTGSKVSLGLIASIVPSRTSSTLSSTIS